MMEIIGAVFDRRLIIHKPHKFTLKPPFGNFEKDCY